nr:unnamed protein product [Callosobruchus analis]
MNTGINRTVVESQYQEQRRKKVQLPTSEDIRCLCDYLAVKRNDAFELLKKKFSLHAWVDLCEATLASIQVFNRRRAGEAERILIEDFKSYISINKENDKELYESLSKQDQSLANTYVRFLIRGKLNRNVPVLLDQHLLACVELILEHRKSPKVSDINPYVFGIQSNEKKRYKYFRACNILRKFAEKCGASNPERLRGTALRKHIATKCITMNLPDNEITQLADFMGHRKDIHKTYYRQSVASQEILRMSRLLQLAQGSAEDSNDDSSENSEDEGDTFHNRKKRSTSPYGKVTRKRWTTEEKNLVLGQYARHIERKTLASLKELGLFITMKNSKE